MAFGPLAFAFSLIVTPVSNTALLMQIKMDKPMMV
jgi:hypothetical protein